MANIAVATAALVRPLEGAVIRRYTAAAAIVVGAPVYLSGNKLVSETNGGAAATAQALGIAIAPQPYQTTIAAGDAVDVVVFGPVTGYTGLAGGTRLFTSDDAGRIGDDAGDTTVNTVLGEAENATSIFVRIRWVQA